MVSDKITTVVNSTLMTCFLGVIGSSRTAGRMTSSHFNASHWPSVRGTHRFFQWLLYDSFHMSKSVKWVISSPLGQNCSHLQTTSNWQLIKIGSGNGLSFVRRQAITWTNIDPVYRRVYAALGGDELKPNIWWLSPSNLLQYIIHHDYYKSNSF